MREMRTLWKNRRRKNNLRIHQFLRPVMLSNFVFTPTPILNTWRYEQKLSNYLVFVLRPPILPCILFRIIQLRWLQGRIFDTHFLFDVNRVMIFAPMPAASSLLVMLETSCRHSLLLLQERKLIFVWLINCSTKADRKSTRLELQSHHELVCRLLLEKKHIPSSSLNNKK